jgi:hypothetical protein
VEQIRAPGLVQDRSELFRRFPDQRLQGPTKPLVCDSSCKLHHQSGASEVFFEGLFHGLCNPVGDIGQPFARTPGSGLGEWDHLRLYITGIECNDILGHCHPDALTTEAFLLY